MPVQERTKRLKEITQKVGLKINKKKSQVMGQNHRNPVSVYLDQELEITDTFTYLGSIVCKEGGADIDIKKSHEYGQRCILQTTTRMMIDHKIILKKNEIEIRVAFCRSSLEVEHPPKKTRMTKHNLENCGVGIMRNVLQLQKVDESLVLMCCCSTTDRDGQLRQIKSTTEIG